MKNEASGHFRLNIGDGVLEEETLEELSGVLWDLSQKKNISISYNDANYETSSWIWSTKGVVLTEAFVQKLVDEACKSMGLPATFYTVSDFEA
jgi:hypothetical protein